MQASTGQRQISANRAVRPSLHELQLHGRANSALQPTRGRSPARGLRRSSARRCASRSWHVVAARRLSGRSVSHQQTKSPIHALGDLSLWFDAAPAGKVRFATHRDPDGRILAIRSVYPASNLSRIGQVRTSRDRRKMLSVGGIRVCPETDAENGIQEVVGSIPISSTKHPTKPFRTAAERPLLSSRLRTASVDILMTSTYVLRQMRTTVRLDPHLLAEAKKVAAANGRTLTAVIEDALRESLTRKGTRRKRSSLKVPTFRGHGTHAGVDLDNSAALLDLMENDRDSHGRQRPDLRAPRRRR